MNIILFVKGLVIGLGKILPGISGSVLAIILNVYEKAIFAINNPFNKKNLKYLLILGSGILISIILFGNIVSFILNKIYFLAMSFFVGLLLGTIPNILKKIKIESKKDYIIIFIPIVIIVLINKISFNFNKSFFLLGIIEAVTTIIPGISGTSIYMMLNCYEKVLNLYSNPFKLSFVFFLLGIIVGGIIISYIISLLFKKYYNKMYLFVSVLSIYSFIYLFLELKIINIIWLLIGFLITFFLNKLNVIK